jgi:hypothetical protein
VVEDLLFALSVFTVALLSIVPLGAIICGEHPRSLFEFQVFLPPSSDPSGTISSKAALFLFCVTLLAAIIRSKLGAPNARDRVHQQGHLKGFVGADLTQRLSFVHNTRRASVPFRHSATWASRSIEGYTLFVRLFVLYRLLMHFIFWFFFLFREALAERHQRLPVIVFSFSVKRRQVWDLCEGRNSYSLKRQVIGCACLFSPPSGAV